MLKKNYGISQKKKISAGVPPEVIRLTYGKQVQSRFKTAPTPVFGSSKRPPLNDAGAVVRN